MKTVATVLSNNVLIRAKREHIKVTPMKLQKLLYYICVKYVKETKELPISESFEVWQYGPVVPSVHSAFQPYGASPIKSMAKNTKEKSMIVDEDANLFLTDCIEHVWNRFKHCTGIELGNRTHQKGSGWYAAFQRDDESISVEDMLNDITI